MGRYGLPAVLLILSVVASIWFLPLMIKGGISWSKDSGCRSCHSGPKAAELKLDDVYAKIATLPYRHSVVEDEKCELCHILRGFKTGRMWEITSSDSHKEQIFFLKDLSMDRKYQVDLKIRDKAGNEVVVSPLQFTPSGVAVSMDNDGKMPLIRNVKVTEIRQAIFLEATIKWDTDKPSNSIVEYGLTDQYGETAASENVFANGHKITLTGLKGGKQYHYRVISRDIFGNAGASDDFMLDTSAQINNTGEDVGIMDRTRPRIKEAAVFKINRTKDIFIKFSSDKPVKAYLVVNEPSEIDKHGFGLIPARASRIDACVKCHPQGASHPVGIRSKGGKTKISPDLPTIEGGMITCVTCHYPHGGERRYFARKDFERDLCIACHVGEPYI